MAMTKSTIAIIFLATFNILASFRTRLNKVKELVDVTHAREAAYALKTGKLMTAIDKYREVRMRSPQPVQPMELVESASADDKGDTHGKDMEADLVNNMLVLLHQKMEGKTHMNLLEFGEFLDSDEFRDSCTKDLEMKELIRETMKSSFKAPGWNTFRNLAAHLMFFDGNRKGYITAKDFSNRLRETNGIQIPEEAQILRSMQTLIALEDAEEVLVQYGAVEHRLKNGDKEHRLVFQGYEWMMDDLIQAADQVQMLKIEAQPPSPEVKDTLSAEAIAMRESARARWRWLRTMGRALAQQPSPAPQAEPTEAAGSGGSLLEVQDDLVDDMEKLLREKMKKAGKADMSSREFGEFVYSSEFEALDERFMNNVKAKKYINRTMHQAFEAQDDGKLPLIYVIAYLAFFNVKRLGEANVLPKEADVGAPYQVDFREYLQYVTPLVKGVMEVPFFLRHFSSAWFSVDAIEAKASQPELAGIAGSGEAFLETVAADRLVIDMGLAFTEFYPSKELVSSTEFDKFVDSDEFRRVDDRFKDNVNVKKYIKDTMQVAFQAHGIVTLPSLYLKFCLLFFDATRLGEKNQEFREQTYMAPPTSPIQDLDFQQFLMVVSKLMEKLLKQEVMTAMPHVTFLTSGLYALPLGMPMVASGPYLLPLAATAAPRSPLPTMRQTVVQAVPFITSSPESPGVSIEPGPMPTGSMSGSYVPPPTIGSMSGSYVPPSVAASAPPMFALSGPFVPPTVASYTGMSEQAFSDSYATAP